MRQRFIMTLASAAVLTACGTGDPKTQADLLIGEWEQTAPISMTQQGQTIIFSDGEVEYKKDGTTEGENIMTLQGMPENMARYKMAAQARYTLENGVITDTITGGTVTALGDSEDARQLATQMQSVFTQTPPSRSTIVTLTDDTLVLRETMTGTEMTYKRD